MKKPKDNILFVYATPENKKFVEELAEKHNEKISTIVNKIVDGFRESKKVNFVTVIPKYVQLAEEWKKKHR